MLFVWFVCVFLTWGEIWPSTAGRLLWHLEEIRRGNFVRSVIKWSLRERRINTEPEWRLFSAYMLANAFNATLCLPYSNVLFKMDVWRRKQTILELHIRQVPNAMFSRVCEMIKFKNKIWRKFYVLI